MISMLIVLALHSSSAGALPVDTMQVSSTEVMFFLRPEARFRDFMLLRIETADDARRAITFIGESSASGDVKYQSTVRLFLKEIDQCNYRKETCLVLFSPRTHDMYLSPAYRVSGTSELVFTVGAYAQSEDTGYAFCRVTVLPKAESSIKVVVKTMDREISPQVYRGAP